ncbi:MAG: helix-turn-helix domain-containing protein [Planctomycetales bacterium]|jgi:excisionase family DNA binding protein
MVAQASSGDGGTRLAVTYREAGDALGVCERVVWQLVKDGRLKAVRIGRSVRIPVAELNRFVSASAESV